LGNIEPDGEERAVSKPEAVVPRPEEPIAGAAFDSDDLSFLQGLIDDLLEELLESGDYPLAASHREALRHRLAIAVFQCAAAGERDVVSLRRRVLGIFFAPASNSAA
jgi:hypothetical protein